MSKRKKLKSNGSILAIVEDNVSLWFSESRGKPNKVQKPKQDVAHEANIKMLYDCLPLYTDETVKARARKMMYNLYEQINDLRIKENLSNIM